MDHIQRKCNEDDNLDNTKKLQKRFSSRRNMISGEEHQLMGRRISSMRMGDCKRIPERSLTKLDQTGTYQSSRNAIPASQCDDGVKKTPPSRCLRPLTKRKAVSRFSMYSSDSGSCRSRKNSNIDADDLDHDPVMRAVERMGPRRRVSKKSSRDSAVVVDLGAIDENNASNGATSRASKTGTPREGAGSITRRKFLPVMRRRKTTLRVLQALLNRVNREEEMARLGAKFRRLAKFLVILFGLWKVHAKKVATFLETNVDLIEVAEPLDLLFDVTQYKAAKQACISEETIRILKKLPSLRSQEEVKYVQIALGNYPSIAGYPNRIKHLMAERAWYEKYYRKRIIIQEGHPSRCYYFILSGSVVVSRQGKSHISTTVCFLKRGEHFGELGLINGACRRATVITKEQVELLVLTDDAYIEIFMSGGLKNKEDPFLRGLSYLEGWPLSQLADNASNAFLTYFKKGTVLVHDSHLSEWIYIIKSGSCTVLKKLRKVKPRKPPQIIPYKPPKTNLPEEVHKQQLEERMVRESERWNKMSLLYRYRLMQDLDLHIKTHPLQMHPNEPAPEPDQQQHQENSQNDSTHKPQLQQHKQKVIPNQSTHQRQQQQRPKVHPKESTCQQQQQQDQQVKPKEPKHQPCQPQQPENQKVHCDEPSNQQQQNQKEESSQVSDTMGNMKQKKRVTIVEGKRSSRYLPRLTTKGSILTQSSLTNATEQVVTAPPDPARDGRVLSLEEELRLAQSNLKKKLDIREKTLQQEKLSLVEALNGGYMHSPKKLTDVDKHPQFVCAKILTVGAAFGLSDVLYQDQPSLSLVSNGAECILIKKKFFLENASKEMLRSVRKQVSPYPREEELQESLQVHVDWNHNRRKLVGESLTTAQTTSQKRIMLFSSAT